MRIVIAGAGEVGSHLAKLLCREGGDVTVIDMDESRLESLSANTDVQTVHADPASAEGLRKARVQKADLFIAVVPHVAEEINVVSAMLAKQLGADKTFARIIKLEFLKEENLQMLLRLGIDYVFCPEQIAANEIVDILKSNASTDNMDFADGQLNVSAFRLGEDSAVLDTTLVDFVKSVPQNLASCFRVIALARNGKTIIPQFDTKFRFGDLVYTISKRENILDLITLLGVTGVDVRRVMVMGGGSIGSLVAEALATQVEHIKVIERDYDRCVSLNEKLPDDVLDNIIVVHGDGRNPDFLTEESIREYDAFVALTGSDEANILACVTAKKLGVQRTIAEVENIEYIKLADEMGVDNIINKKLITAGRIFKHTLSEKTSFARYMSGTDAEVMEYTATEGSAVVKGPLKNINFPKGAVIGGVVRGNEAFIAVGDTRIQPGDKVAVFALPTTAKAVDKLFK